MASSVSCYFDFTCGYSYRFWSWFRQLRQLDTRLEVEWLPFVLKEVNRPEGKPSLLAGPKIESVAVFALAAAEAMRGLPRAEGFMSELFVAMHSGDERPGRDELATLADRSGLDVVRFLEEEAFWIERVRQSHVGAIGRWGVFGTPTLVLGDAAPMYLKLVEVPTEDHLSKWRTITSIALDSPEIAELKRPSTTN